MVITLVLATFILLVVHDYYLQRRHAHLMEMKTVAPEVREEAPAFPMNVVGGFKAPAHLAYHPSHTWAMKESRQVVRVGLDDFAARVMGQFDQIDLPLMQEPVKAQPVFFGGPVQPDRGFVLHAPLCEWQSSLTVTDEIALTTSKDVLIAVSDGKGPERMLVTLGYAGWGSGQLEEEIASNGWLTVPCNTEILFSMPAEKRYDAAMALHAFEGAPCPETAEGRTPHRPSR